MSHPGKVDLLKQAQAAGYRTYLYFVATDDPAINISRVRNRVKLGGHAVPEDRIEKRYHRSLDLLMKAIRHTNRAYIFDNSGDNAAGRHTWLAEITEGKNWRQKLIKYPPGSSTRFWTKSNKHPQEFRPAHLPVQGSWKTDILIFSAGCPVPQPRDRAVAF